MEATMRRITQPAKRKQLSETIDSFLDLQPGDLVVHVAHGIARFRGIEILTKGQQEEEHLHLEFADTQALYVPISKIGLVQRYVGGNKHKPKLAKIGGQLWTKQKKAVQGIANHPTSMLTIIAEHHRDRILLHC